MPISKPTLVKSAIRQFKLAGTEDSGALIINQVTEVAAGKVTSVATQETLQDEDTSNKDDNNNDGNDDKGGKDNDDDSDNNNTTMDVDSGILKVLHPEERQPIAPTKATVTEVIAPAPVGLCTLFNSPF
ncbi:hypothetical protein C0995_008061 [Termitomyces sp. Mi166|nr:hypothetical protein C0995_008061 [Termitomyces sp. Mi166\